MNTNVFRKNQTTAVKKPAQPATKNKVTSHGGDQDNTQVFANKKHPEFHSRIFRMKTCNQFTFRFRNIKGQAMCFCNTGNKENNKTHRLRNNKPVILLRQQQYRSSLKEPDSITTPINDKPINTS